MIKTLLPPATIGMIGGGQLGMMTIREAHRMGYQSVVWDPDPECPAAKLADRTITASFQDDEAATQLAKASDVVTYEFENIDAATVETIESIRPVFPGSAILRVTQHRKVEKETLRGAGFPVVGFATANNLNELKQGIQQVGYPAVIKTATAGYDGKGQAVIRHEEDLKAFLGEAEKSFVPSVIEQFLDLQVEISVITIRTGDGGVTSFPVLENEHRENILHVTRVPAGITAEIEREAVELGRSVIRHFGIIGVLCIEMFVTREGTVLINELAPRPHNSGHFSLDAASISQFEALVRGVCGLPLQQPMLLSPCAMVNLLGKHLERIDLAEAQRIEGIKVHLYGKSRLEPKRKMGHITVIGGSREEVEERVQTLEELIGEGGGSKSNSQTTTRKSISAV